MKRDGKRSLMHILNSVDLLNSINTYLRLKFCAVCRVIFSLKLVLIEFAISYLNIRVF